MIAAFDPGLGHTGLALLELDGELLEADVVVTAAVFTRSGKGRKIGARGDEQRRIAEVGARVFPIVRRCSLVAVEWPPSAFGNPAGTATGAAAVRTGTAAATTGKIAAMICGVGWGMGRAVWAPASVSWRAALGYKAGTEAELHGAMFHRYGAQLAHVPRGLLPHVLDAIGLARARLEFAD